MWSVLEHRVISKALKRAPREIIVKYEAWKRIIELTGPKGLKQFKGFHDEALKGEWTGYRSSRLNKQWRVIYLIKGDSLEVLAIELTPHDYRKK